MYCSDCRFPLEAEDLFCRRCGTETPTARELSIRPKLRLSQSDRKLAGVCGGVARYLGKDPRMVRAVWTGASLLPFSPGLLAYGICWAVMAHQQKQPDGSPAADPSVHAHN